MNERVIKNRIFQLYDLGILRALERAGKIPKTVEEVDDAVDDYLEEMFHNSIGDWDWK